MEDSVLYLCPYCCGQYAVPSESILLSHIKMVHSSDPDFIIHCPADDCCRTFTNFRTYQNHCLTHRNRVSVIAEEVSVEQNSHSMEIGEIEQSETDRVMSPVWLPSVDDVKSFMAKWLLKTSETRSLTRTATTGIVEDVTGLIDYVVQCLSSKTSSILVNNGIDTRVITEVEESFSSAITKPFEGLHSFHHQMQYYLQHFNLIEPQRITLKETSTHRLAGRRRKIVVSKTEIMYIPLLETLQAQLNNRSILHEVNNCHKSSHPGYLSDYCDGIQFQNHTLFSVNPTSLQIILYYDELELCNPLGSRRSKHKIGVFYYILGNIRPQFRAKLRNIQLLLITKYDNVKEFGIDRMLQPIVDDVKKLESESGVPFIIDGQTHFFRGSTSVASADNPASTLLGGFKQTASAFRYCRHCNGTELDIQSKFTESAFQLRSAPEHSRQCDIFEQDDLSSFDYQHFSMMFGVNRRSLLTSLTYFDVTSGSLIPDVMHDFLEGVIPLELKLMLKVFVTDEKLFTLEDVDNCFKKLNLRLFDGDKPSPSVGISLTTASFNLQQHAMQSWTMARFFPFVMGHLIPEGNKYWENFLCLLEIMNMVFARIFPKEECGYLECLIHEHHYHFKELYPDVSITMKMHSMVHLPRLILEFGPLINHWTARFEAKHKYFKRLANVMGNYTNICYSLALRHQLHNCYTNLNDKALFAENIEVGPGASVTCPSSSLWNTGTPLSVSTLFRAKWVKVNGTKYQIPFAINIGSEDDELKFANIIDIFVDDNTVFFEFIPFNTHGFSNHFNAYILDIPADRSQYLIKQDELLDFNPYGIYRSCSVDGVLGVT